MMVKYRSYSNLEIMLKEVLKENCTESDDHDFPHSECKKCKRMIEQLMGKIIAWNNIR